MSEKFDISKVSNLQFEGIDHRDYPDYCDSYVVSGDYDGEEMTDEQLEELDSYPDFVYEKLMNHIF